MNLNLTNIKRGQNAKQSVSSFLHKKNKSFDKWLSANLHAPYNRWQRIDKSTGQMVDEHKWLIAGCKIKRTNEESRKANEFLDALKVEVFEHRTEFIRAGIPVNYVNIKNKIFNVLERPLSLVEIFEDHNRKFKELVGQEYAASTLQRYETTLKHVQQFLTWKYKITDINIKKIDHSFITEFEFFLRSERKCANNSTVKYMKNFGKIIRICLDSHWIEKQMSHYKTRYRRH